MKRFLLMIKYRQYRWAARLLGILGLVFFMSNFTAEGIEDFTMQSRTRDLTIVLVLCSLCFVSYIVSWSAEIVGGMLLTLSAILLPSFVYFFEDIPGFTSIIYYGIPFLIPGILFIVAWRIKVIRKSASE